MNNQTHVLLDETGIAVMSGTETEMKEMKMEIVASARAEFNRIADINPFNLNRFEAAYDNYARIVALTRIRGK